MEEERLASGDEAPLLGVPLAGGVGYCRGGSAPGFGLAGVTIGATGGSRPLVVDP